MDLELAFHLAAFAFYFLVNAAIALFGSRRVSGLALIASASSPVALFLYVCAKDAAQRGIAATLSDPKLVPLLLEVAVPLAVGAAIAAKAAQIVVGRWHNRRIAA